ncbi:MAG TPA: Gfo/Idh/MocA family oxidoreductase [Armatimonadota bacterium]
MGKAVKLGVVGLGMGGGHVEGYQAHPEAEVVAICDTNPERLNEKARKYGIAHTFTDAETMLKQCKLDAISVATPNAWHAPITIAALKRGLHVLCEKPMAMTVKESEKMLAAAEKSGKNLMINFSYRFSPMSYALKQQVDAGVVGDIYFGRTVWHRRYGFPGFGGWFGQKALSGGGPLIDLGVHRLDLALWLMGYPEPSLVLGSSYDHLARIEVERQQKAFDVEDLACGMVKFTNGATLLLEASWAGNTDEAEHMVTKLYGTKGGLCQSNNSGGYQYQAEIYTREGENFFTKRLDATATKVPSAYAEFVDSILEGRRPLASGEEGLKVMKILEGIYRSAVTGHEVQYK